MAKSNRDRVGEIMDALKEGLGPFVLREYKQFHKGGRYLQELELTLNSNAYSAPHLPDEATALAKVDVQGWLNLMVRQWNDIFREKLGKSERSYVGELQDARNDWAHQKPITNEEAYRTADTATRLLDNIFTERLWRTVKYEEVYLKDYASPREARSGLSAYLDFYNHRRLHQALGYQTPASIYFKKGERPTDNLPPFLS